MKKGVSSLIITVLLVGFTIVLAFIMFTWTTDLLKEDTKTTTCNLELQKLCALTSVEISNVEVNNSGAIKIFIENRGSYEIKAIRTIAFLSNNTIYSSIINFSRPLIPYYPINFTLNYLLLEPIPNPAYKSLEVTPIISTTFEEKICETICSTKAVHQF